MRPKYYDFEGYGFDEHMVLSRARREKDRVARRRLKDRDVVARHRENWDDDWDDDDDDEDFGDFDDEQVDLRFIRVRR